MNPTDDAPDSGLPSDLALRLNRLAVASTADSRPFPRLDSSIRRSRITRYGGLALACVVAAAVIAVEILAGTGTSGSLGQDRAWLDAFATRARSATPDAPEDGTVQVVSAGDIASRARFAVVLLETAGPSGTGARTWTRQIWLGPAGGSATALHLVQSQSGDAPGEFPADPVAYFGTAEGDSESLKDAVVVAAAPGADQVALTSQRYFDEGDLTSPSWGSHSVSTIGPGVWAASVKPAEYFVSETSIDLLPITSLSEAPGFDLAAVAAPGTDPADLTWLTGTMDPHTKPTLREKPLYAATTPTGPDGQLAAAVWRSPEGVYLFDLVDHDSTEVWHGNGLRPAGARLSTLMAGTRIDHRGTYRYLLLAPEGSTRARVGDVTAPVHHRLAAVDVPDEGENGSTPTQAEFLDAGGSVIGRVQPELGDGTSVPVTGPPPGDPTSIRP